MLLYTSVPSVSTPSRFPRFPIPLPISPTKSLSSPRKSHFNSCILIPNSSATDDSAVTYGDGELEIELEPDPDNEEDLGVSDCGVEIEIEKIGKNKRRIRSKIRVKATLQDVWDVLTDYEKLADFIPSLAVSQLLEKRENFARLFQVGEQNLAFGIKFNAKGIVDCFENELESLPFGQRRDIEFKMIEGDFKLFQGKWSVEQLESLPFGQRRDIEFKMIEGDFKLFQGKWSVEQCNIVKCEQSESFPNQEFETTLSYVVDVEPKLWLPVRLVEGRLCREINMNLSSIGKEAQKAYDSTLSAL